MTAALPLVCLISAAVWATTPPHANARLVRVDAPRAAAVVCVSARGRRAPGWSASVRRTLVSPDDDDRVLGGYFERGWRMSRFLPSPPRHQLVPLEPQSLDMVIAQVTIGQRTSLIPQADETTLIVWDYTVTVCWL
jgi:hypothetical protein